MADEIHQEELDSGPFDLREIVAAFYQGWFIVVFCVVLAVLYGLNFLHNATYLYLAQMQVTPPQSSEDASANRLSALGGLASFASSALPPPTSTQFRLYVESLTARDLADELAKDQGIMRTVFADQWDTRSQTWLEPPVTGFNRFKLRVRSWIGLRPAPAWHAPDGEWLQAYLNDTLVVTQDSLKPYLVKVAFRNPDPQFATDFLNRLSATADQLLRQKALLRSTQYIKYLSGELSKVTLAEHRLALAEAMGQQERYAMVANSGAPFAADIFERPWVGSTPAEPSARQVLMNTIILGIALGGVLAFLYRRLTRKWRLRRSSGYQDQTAAGMAE